MRFPLRSTAALLSTTAWFRNPRPALAWTTMSVSGGANRRIPSGGLRHTLSTKNNDVKPIRWGILSAGKISSDFSKAVAITEGAEATAVAARSASKAKEFAAKHDIPKSYGSYDDLLKDPEVDVVYVGSVADQHAKLATSSLLAGKPTVVEKPLTLSLKDTEMLVDLARRKDLFLMEGMWTRCFPAMVKVRELIRLGAIGDPIAVQGDFGWNTEGCGDDDRIWYPKSGGMTLDIGVYMCQLGQIAFESCDVERIQAMATKKNGVDLTTLASVQYSNEQEELKGMLQFYVTGAANTEERVVIQGSKGRIVLDPPAHVPTVVRLFTDEGRGASKETVFEYPLPDDLYTTWNYPGSIGFTHQIKAVGHALRNGEKECSHFTLDDSLQLAFKIESILDHVQDTAYEQQKVLAQ